MQATEPAYPPAPLQGPPPGLPRPRSGQTAGHASGVGSGTDPGRPLPARHVRHRPVPALAPLARLPAGMERDPARWLAFHRPLGDLPRENRCCQRNPDGLRLPKPAAPRQRARPRAFPPTCIETFAIHPAAGVRGLWHGGGGCGKRNNIVRYIATIYSLILKSSLITTILSVWGFPHGKPSISYWCPGSR